MSITIPRKLNEFIEARNPRERVILFGAVLIVLAYAWGMLFFDSIYHANTDLAGRITDMRAMIMTQNDRVAELNALLRGDPDSPGRMRQRELQQANTTADQRLQDLYSQLIDPRQMAETLTVILQRDTALRLITLENVAPQLLHSSNIAQQSNTSGNVALYKHGLHMEFEGSFMETVSYLRGLEQLEDDFYWENLEFSVLEYPAARIRLDIYTLSTQEDWIGV